MRLFARMTGDSPFKSLEEAKSCADAVVILQGDYGGTIYMVCPASLVQCPEQRLRQLLDVIDEAYWGDPNGTDIFYERFRQGENVQGGMGGGWVTSGIWVHQELVGMKLDPLIKAVIEGQSLCFLKEKAILDG